MTYRVFAVKCLRFPILAQEFVLGGEIKYEEWELVCITPDSKPHFTVIRSKIIILIRERNLSQLLRLKYLM